MHPVLAHEQAVQLAQRLKDHIFHQTTHHSQWVNTNGGKQYWLWYAEGLGPSPLAIRIEELIDIMYSFNLDWYVRQVLGEWNRLHAPDAQKDRNKRIILDYREECLKYGRTQQLQATQSKALKRQYEQAAATTHIEHKRWKGLALTIIHTGTVPGKSRRERTDVLRGQQPAHDTHPGRHAGVGLSATVRRASADERARV